MLQLKLTESGYSPPDRHWLPETLLERLGADGFEILTAIDFDPRNQLGSFAPSGGMARYWLESEPERMAQFSSPQRMGRAEWLERITSSERFYAHIFLRETHRPWAQEDDLWGLLGRRNRARLEYRQRRRLRFDDDFDAEVASARPSGGSMNSRPSGARRLRWPMGSSRRSSRRPAPDDVTTRVFSNRQRCSTTLPRAALPGHRGTGPS